jgi:flagellar capping protein FliD
VDLYKSHATKYRCEDGKIRVDGSISADVADTATMQKLFGVDSLELGTVSGTQASEVKGQNAIVEIDGLVTERSSNNFTVNGLNFNLKETTGTYEAATGILKTSDGSAFDLSQLKDGQYIENGTVYNADGTKTDITGLTYEKDGQTVTADGLRMNGDKLEIFNGTTETIQVDRDTDQIIEGIKSFVDEYNKLIKTLNDYLDEDTSYKEYAPLTDAQKKEMSEKEIELWEEKAKEGLLHRDSTIDSFLQSMRTALYEKPVGCAYALYDLGIETGEWESKGQLVFTSDSEAKLRQVLESDPESVMQLFTDSEEGIFTKINNIMDDTAKISSGSPGALVELAGVKGKASESNNTLYEQIKDIDDRIAALKETYEREKNRYWSEFNTMEQLISNMNVQSSWLSQQFSSM